MTEDRQPILQAHSDLIADLIWEKPHHIAVNADPQDVSERVDHMCKIAAAFSKYMGILIDDLTDNLPVGHGVPREFESEVMASLDRVIEKAEKAAQELEEV